MKLTSCVLMATSMLVSLSMMGTAEGTEQSLPPVLYVSTVDSDELYNRLKQAPSLENMDKESVGNPVRLLISYKFEPTAGGTAAGLTSAILAGGSLGILPMVSNDDLVLTYEFRVHNQVIASFSYRENFTQAKNMYSNAGLYSLDGKALAWAVGTTERFLADIGKDQALLDLTEEYHYYFGDQ